MSFIAFQNHSTVLEIIIKGVLKSFSNIARLKEEENHDTSDQFEVFRVNDHTFQELLSNPISNIFQKILALNVGNVKNEDRQLYNRIKYLECMDIMNAKREDVVSVVDRNTGETKVVSAN